jgi:hypothetical protein
MPRERPIGGHDPRDHAQHEARRLGTEECAGALAVGDADHRQRHEAGGLLGRSRRLHAGREAQHDRQGDRQERWHHPEHEHPPRGGGEEPAAHLGAHEQVHDDRVDAEPGERGGVAGQEAGDQLAEVDLALVGGGVGEELAGAALALADDRRGADRRGDGERHHDGHRGEQEHGQRVGGLAFGGVAGDLLLRRLRQDLQRLRHLVDHLDIADLGDGQEQDGGDEEEEDGAEEDHRHPEAAVLDQLAEVGARHDPHARPAEVEPSASRRDEGGFAGRAVGGGGHRGPSEPGQPVRAATWR